MSRGHLIAATALGAIVLTGCRGTGPEGTPRMLTVDGCLTAGNGGLVLTRLTPAGGTASAVVEPGTTAPPPQQATEIYALQGMDDQLRPNVGRQVRVSGEAPPQRVAVVREQTPAATAGSGAAQPSGTSGVEPRVSTTERTRFETTELRVRTVTALNEPCAAPR